MWNANIILNKLFRSVEEKDDMEVAGITDAIDLIEGLLEALPSEHTEMDIHDFLRKNMSYSSFTPGKNVNTYINDLQKKIEDLNSLEWDDTINNFRFGNNIQIVHKSLESKSPEEKRSIITRFINDTINSLKTDIEKARESKPVGRSKSAGPSFSPFERPQSSIAKTRIRPKSSLSKSSSHHI